MKQNKVINKNMKEEEEEVDCTESSRISFPAETIKERTKGTRVPHLPVGESDSNC